MGRVSPDPRQLAVLARLQPVLADAFYLAGGVGIAVHLGHRVSRDLDIFGPSDPVALLSALERLKGIAVSNRAIGTLQLVADGIPVSLLQYDYQLIEEPALVPDIPIPVASLLDLACMKLSAIVGRGAARDFWDLHSIVVATGKALDPLLAAFRVKFPAADVGHVVRSLVYFGDAEAEPLPRGLSRERWTAVKSDLVGWVVALD